MLAGLLTLLQPTRRALCTSLVAAATWRPEGGRAIGGQLYSPVPGSGTDGREYGALQLSSGLRAVVGSSQSLDRVELALTVQCGHLFDGDIDGLAHLAEHVTLAADPADLGGFIEERVGALNAFTAEETTTFHLEFDLDDIAYTEVHEVCRRFSALFPSISIGGSREGGSREGWCTSRELVLQELPRIHAEWQALVRAPPRQALELAALKRAATPTHIWGRFGRGDTHTMPLSDADALARAVDVLRTTHYSMASASLSLISPLPLESAAQVLLSTFSSPSRAPAQRLILRSQPPLTPKLGSDGSPDSAADVTLPLSEHGGRPIAVEIARGGRSLTAAWCLPFSDPVTARRSKPLALLGMALTSPHAESLAGRLRAAGLAPPICSQEPVVLVRTVAQTRSWAIWQVEIVLVEGAEARWREALQLCRGAVALAGERGVPTHVAAESETLAALAWHYSSRPPTALELSIDLQAEPEFALAIRSGRSFIGDAAANAAAASAIARRCVTSTPVVTLYIPSLEAIGLDTTTRPSDGVQPEAPPLPMRFAPLSALTAPGGGGGGDVADGTPPIVPPPVNSWVVPSGPAVVRPVMQPLRVGACDGYREGGALPSCLQARTEDGLGLLQLPACISGTGVELGGRGALAAVGCAAVPRPFGVVLLQLYTRRPQQAYNGDQRATAAAALAELWRYALAEAVGVEGALAARAGAKWEVSFNPAGLRFAVSGHREQLRALLSRVLQLALRRAPPASEFEAGRSAALRVARTQLAAKPTQPDMVRAREAALRTATREDLVSEIGELWGSVLAADLLIAGPVREAEAALLVADTRAQLRPVLPTRGDRAQEPDRIPDKAFASGLAAWEPLLYRPAYEPRPLAQNLCLEPALAATLDQCGSL